MTKWKWKWHCAISRPETTRERTSNQRFQFHCSQPDIVTRQTKSFFFRSRLCLQFIIIIVIDIRHKMKMKYFAICVIEAMNGHEQSLTSWRWRRRCRHNLKTFHTLPMCLCSRLWLSIEIAICLNFRTRNNPTSHFHWYYFSYTLLWIYRKKNFFFFTFHRQMHNSTTMSH